MRLKLLRNEPINGFTIPKNYVFVVGKEKPVIELGDKE